MKISDTEKKRLRDLAAKIRDYASDPVMKKRREQAKQLTELENVAPMVHTAPEGAWREIMPDDSLVCSDPILMEWEKYLAMRVFHFENIKDDQFFDATIELPWQIDQGDFGIELQKKHSDSATGSYAISAAIDDIHKDISRLHFRNFKVNRERSRQVFEKAEELLGDLITVRRSGFYWWTLGLTWQCIDFIGLENLMLKMYDDPEGIHKIMAWLRDEALHMLNWHEEEGLLTTNNGLPYIGSGGSAFAASMPDVFAGHEKLALKDTWGFSESQETIGISPEMFAEFILPYQKPLMEKFGKVYYGCCEPIDKRFRYLKDIDNLRILSVSPWCNQESLVEQAGNNYMYIRKPNPADVLTADWQSTVRADVSRTLDIFKGKSLQFILKDTHTINNEPERFSEWVEIVREEIGKQV